MKNLEKADEYVPFKLTTDLSVLTDKERRCFHIFLRPLKLRPTSFGGEA